MTYATCGCGTDIATETAAQRHAAVCPRMGEPGTREATGDAECCASGRCEVCTPGFDWGRDG